MQEQPNPFDAAEAATTPATPPVFNSPIPIPSGDMPAMRMNQGINDSGTGATAVLPAELQGFNWSACLMTWIWSIGHNTWIGLLALIVPFPIMNIILGIKGSEWAWQYRKWDSVEQFRETQRVWLIWGIILKVLQVIVVVALFTMWLSLLRYAMTMQPSTPSGGTFVPPTGPPLPR